MLGLAAYAFAVLAAPLPAPDRLDPTTLESELLRPFLDVCMVNIGDPRAQFEAAATQGWGEGELTEVDGLVSLHYEGNYQRSISVEGEAACAVSVLFEEDPDFSEGVLAISSTFGGTEPNQVITDGEGPWAYWLISRSDRDERLSVDYAFGDHPDGTIATIMISNLAGISE